MLTKLMSRPLMINAREILAGFFKIEFMMTILTRKAPCNGLHSIFLTISSELVTLFSKKGTLSNMKP